MTKGKRGIRDSFYETYERHGTEANPVLLVHLELCSGCNLRRSSGEWTKRNSGISAACDRCVEKGKVVMKTRRARV